MLLRCVSPISTTKDIGMTGQKAPPMSASKRISCISFRTLEAFEEQAQKTHQ